VKLLFDQNISFRIVDKISKDFLNANQVKQLGLTDAKDLEIWKYAKDNGFTIVTFDADFYDLATYLGHPPKIIWLRTGNRTTDKLAELLISQKNMINDFITDSQYDNIACIEIN
jgi:predicted nuclease of predicted toxin-antitoxin system